MTTDLLFKNFHLLADTPGGVKKLRQLILQLAVQGRLVPQNPDDPPASELLQQIKAEKQRLIKEGKLKKQKPLPEIKPDEVPFELPLGWEWARLGSVLQIEYGKSLPASKRNQSGNIPVFGSNGIVGHHDKYYIQEPAVIIGRKGSSGALNIAKGPCWPTDVTYYTIPPEVINFGYCYILLKSLNLETLGKGIKPGLNRNEAYLLLVCIPPLPEQHRIVAKVDQLMALCDELEARQEKQKAAHTRLNKSALHALTESRTREELTFNWTRIKDNFNFLITTPESIQELRSSILQLAVQGRLVPQNPDDERASMLLEEISKEKKQLIKEGKIKKQKPLPEIKPEEVPFELPNNWAWVRFQDMGIFGRGKSKHRPRNDPDLYENGYIPVVQTGDIARSNGKVTSYTGLYNQKGLSQSMLWPKGTLCITIAANIADSAILDFEACFPDSVVGFVPSGYIKDARYFDYFIRTAKQNLFSYAPATAQKNINIGILNQLLIPLPPLSEMKGIVAKVDQLMHLCDELESSLTRSQADGQRLMQSVVAGLSETNCIQTRQRDFI